VSVQKKTLPCAPNLSGQFIADPVSPNRKISLVICGVADPSDGRVDDGFFKSPSPEGDRYSRQ
jgi:hypothetical protein